MTTSVLCKGVTAVQAAPVNGVLPCGSQAIQPNTDWSNVTNPIEQTFQINVTGTAGNVSATVQILASNDNVNWVNYGSAIVVSSAASPNVTSATGSAAWEWFSAYVTAISGTGASVTCLMGT